MKRRFWPYLAVITMLCACDGGQAKRDAEEQAARSFAESNRKALEKPAKVRVLLSTDEYELLEAQFAVLELSSLLSKKSCLIYRDKALKTSTMSCGSADLGAPE